MTGHPTHETGNIRAAVSFITTLAIQPYGHVSGLLLAMEKLEDVWLAAARMIPISMKLRM